VQSHSDFSNFTSTSTASPHTSSVVKKTEGRWEHGSLIEPLQIHVPPPPALTNYASSSSIFANTPVSAKGLVSSGSNCSALSGSSGSSETKPSTTTRKQKGHSRSNKTINDCILNLHQQHQNNLIHNNSLSILIPTTTVASSKDQSGCSRTIPLSSWSQNSYPQHNVHIGPDSSTTLLQIKREPCQVSEVTTSNNNLGTSTPSITFPPSTQTTIIKIEQKSPTTNTSSSTTSTTTSSTLACSSTMDTITSNSVQNTCEFLYSFIPLFAGSPLK
jgi:hypothetical protein